MWQAILRLQHESGRRCELVARMSQGLRPFAAHHWLYAPLPVAEQGGVNRNITARGVML